MVENKWEHKEVEIQMLPGSREPFYAHEDDSGMDIFSSEKLIIKPGERKIVPTNIRVAIPKGFEIQVRPKSGLSSKKGITVLNTPGTIDSSYRGQIGVIIINHGKEEEEIGVHKKVAQIVLSPVYKIKWKHVIDLDDTSRGEGGFGSSGE